MRRREGLFDSQTTGYRCIHGESDGWPGLVLDRYGDTRVLKIYTAAWLPRLKELTPLLAQQDRLVLRLSRNIQKMAAERFNAFDGQELPIQMVRTPRCGVRSAQRADPTFLVQFMENGLRFEADVVCGQKTGFFLDQREKSPQKSAPWRTDATF